MEFVETAYTIPLFVTALGAAGFAVLAWLKREEPGGRALVVYLACISVGSFAYGMDVSTVPITAKYNWVRIALVAMGVTGSAWLYFALHYTGKDRWVNRRVALALSVEPVALGIVMLVPALQSLVYELPATGGTGPMGETGAEPGVAIMIHFLYMVVTMLSATLLFVALFLRSRHLARDQAVAVLIAAIVPWGGVIIRGIGLAGAFDPSIFVWAFSGMAMTVSLYRFRLFDPVPTAYASIIESMGDGVLVLGPNDCIGDVNPAASELLDLDPAAAVGQPIGEVLDDWQSIADESKPAGPTPSHTGRTAMSTDGGADGGVVGVTGDTHQGDWPADGWQDLTVDVDGTRRHLRVEVMGFHDHHDRLVGRHVVFHDVTPLKRRELSLARYKRVFETVQDPVFVLDGEGTFLLVNEPLGSLLGEDADAVLDRPFESILTAETDPADVRPAALAAADRTELDVARADGQVVPCETRVSAVTFDDEIQGYVGLIHDISRRKRTERHLEETTERLETLVEASPLAIVSMDVDGNVEVWNPAAEEMFGWNAEEVVGGPPPVVPDDRLPEIESVYERVLDGERITDLETTLERADGSHVETSVSVAPLTDDRETVQGMVAVIADLSERIAYERELERKNERLDEFASLVSHDIRNPLSVARGYLHLAHDDPSYIEKVEDAHQRIDRIIDEVLELSREGRMIDDPEPLPLETPARLAWESVHTAAADLQIDLGEASVVGDETRLRSLFENLYRNAVEHGGESVQVTVGTFEDGQGFFLADDGPGIDPEIKAQVFESGFSTNSDGTGFGLSIVQDIAEAHGWTVEVTNTEPSGVRFEFRDVEFC